MGEAFFPWLGALTMEGRYVLTAALMVFLSAIALCDSSSMSDVQVAQMSKGELISALKKSQSHGAAVDAKLHKMETQINALQAKKVLQKKIAEKKRIMSEKTQKTEDKKKELNKRQSKLAQKQQLAEILMDAGAKYLAFIAAKKNVNRGSVVQQRAVLKAARKGGRAGAVGPLKKVARAAAVDAVKKARHEAKAAHKRYHKHQMRKISVAAAKKAVHKVLRQQDVLVEKSAQKWTKAAIAKYQPAIELAKPSDKPNNFVAPPTIHLAGLLQAPQSAAAGQVAVKAAAKAKRAAGKLVQEEHH